MGGAGGGRAARKRASPGPLAGARFYLLLPGPAWVLRLAPTQPLHCLPPAARAGQGEGGAGVIDDRHLN